MTTPQHAKSWRILLTNHALVRHSGTELWVRDAALALARRGHQPFVYSPRLGAVADLIRAGGVAVVDDLNRLDFAPDIIHGHHHPETMTALSRFPQTPAIHFCHGLPWVETPLHFPRIVRHVAVDHACRDRLRIEGGIAPEQVRVLFNWVDMEKFKPRPPLPARPRRALLFSNYATDKGDVPIVREACEKAGVKLDIIGSGVGRQSAAPQEILGDYDLVFAKARCALEALATGCAVVLCDLSTLGPMVRYEDLQGLRDLNFGVRARTFPLRADLLANQIARYDAEDAAQVSAWIRERAGLEAAMDGLEEIYREALWEYSRWNISAPEWQEQEARATAEYLRSISLRWQEADGWRIDRDAVRASRDALQTEYELLRADREQVRSAQQALKAELEAARLDCNAIKKDRDALNENRDEIKADREAIRQNRDEVKENRDALRLERDQLRGQLQATQDNLRILEASRAVRWSRNLKSRLSRRSNQTDS